MQSLRLFCQVATCRSFSRAAAELGITQSAVSQRIGQLEKKLGVRLIDRSVRPLALTPAGEVFLAESRDLLNRYDDLERRVAQFRDRPVGEVRVDAIYSAGIGLLNQIRESFEQQAPEVTVAIEYTSPSEVYEAVRSGRCDLGIVSYPSRWRGVETIALRDEPMAVVCRPDHPFAGRPVVQAGDLSQATMMTFDAGLPVAQAIQRYLRDQDVKPSVTSAFDNIDTIKNAVAESHDVAILPKRTVRREVTAGALVSVPLKPELLRPVGVIHRRRRRNGTATFPAAVQAFVDYLLAHAGPDVDAAAQTGDTQATENETAQSTDSMRQRMAGAR